MKESNVTKVIKSLKENGIFYTIHRIITAHLIPKIDSWILMFCIKLQRDKKLEDVIIMESFSDFDCNTGAIYDYFIQNKMNEKYKLVWILNYDNIRKDLPKNVECYKKNSISLKKNLRIVSAKYLIADNNIVKKVRGDQTLIYCTHGGICFKDVRDKMNYRDLNIDYVLSPSENYENFVVNEYNLDTKITKILNIGYPSLDIFFQKTENEYDKFLDRKFNKYILWMPTFRRGHGNRNDSDEEFPLGIPLLKTQQELEKLNDLLKKFNNILIIKMHPGQKTDTYKNLKDKSNIKIITPAVRKKYNLNAYNLMKYTDVLISDYSGAAYEYLLLNRPLGFVVSDIENYKIGFIVDNIFDYMPGDLIRTTEDFINFFNSINNNLDLHKEKREKLLKYFYKYRDGDSAERLVKYLKI